MPQRIQRKRTKGWTTPLCSCGCGRKAIYVGRPSRWGNPYEVHEHTLRCAPMHALCPPWPVDSRQEAVRRFRYDLLYPLTHHPDYPDLDTIRWELAGHDLVCWCPLDDGHGNRVPCHADVLLELANQGEVR